MFAREYRVQCKTPSLRPGAGDTRSRRPPSRFLLGQTNEQGMHLSMRDRTLFVGNQLGEPAGPRVYRGGGAAIPHRSKPFLNPSRQVLWGRGIKTEVGGGKRCISLVSRPIVAVSNPSAANRCGGLGSFCGVRPRTDRGPHQRRSRHRRQRPMGTRSHPRGACSSSLPASLLCREGRFHIMRVLPRRLSYCGRPSVHGGSGSVRMSRGWHENYA